MSKSDSDSDDARSERRSIPFDSPAPAARDSRIRSRPRWNSEYVGLDSSDDCNMPTAPKRGRERGRRILSNSPTPRARGKGRARRQRGGRGDRRPNRAELAVRTRQDREAYMETCISSIESESLRNALRLVCSKQPSFLLDILQTIQGHPEQPQSSHTVPSW